MTSRKYEGDWELVPELSFYDEGEPSKATRYKIHVENGSVQFSIDWTVDGTEHSVVFAGSLDGTRHEINAPPGAEASYEHVDAYTLISSVFVNGDKVASARRRASKDGTLLAVQQASKNNDGSWSKITQIYRRLP